MFPAGNSSRRTNAFSHLRSLNGEQVSESDLARVLTRVHSLGIVGVEVQNLVGKEPREPKREEYTKQNVAQPNTCRSDFQAIRFRGVRKRRDSRFLIRAGRLGHVEDTQFEERNAVSKGGTNYPGSIALSERYDRTHGTYSWPQFN